MGTICKKMQVEFWSLYSAHRLIMLYVFTKFHENTYKGFRVIEGQDFQDSNFQGAQFRNKCRQSYGLSSLHIV